jgi:DNA-3-methyladenine glycosylase II
MARFTTSPRGPFSLEEARRFLQGFGPASHEPESTRGHLHIAVVPDGEAGAGGACVQMDGDDVLIETFGRADADATHRQVEGMLSLQVDATEFASLGDREPVVGRMLRAHPGWRPVSFPSAFEAGTWFLLSHRVRMTQAAAIKARMRDELGDAVAVHEDVLRAFPGPEVIAGLEAFSGVPDRKLGNLRALAHAALEGRLGAERLRQMPEEEALTELCSLPGVGPFTAQGILLRGAGAPDVLAPDEPRIAGAAALAYGLDESPDRDELAVLAERWRPFRSWVQMLLRTALEEHRAATGPGA